jgi:nitrite reductase/ring-hydroxylating ferredoxin subunit
MSEGQASLTGPDLTQGVSVAKITDGAMLLGHAHGEAVLLARRGDEFFAVSAVCTHYSGPLAEGLFVDVTVRCPWHHACFDLRTGEALHAPAFSPIACWSVEQRDGKIFVRDKREQPARKRSSKISGQPPEKIVIIGGGAAGFAAAERLRREQYTGALVMLSNEQAAPIDRPNLSKDYLAGNAPEDWLPLRPDTFYSDNGIELRLKADVGAIDPRPAAIVAQGRACQPAVPGYRKILRRQRA